MYLHQKLNWSYKHIGTKQDWLEMEKQYFLSEPWFDGVDTETNGLHHMVAKPFLMSFGWLGHVYTLDMLKTPELVKPTLTILGQSDYMFAHNAKFDYHMFTQFGLDVNYLELLPWADSITLARLTNYADAEIKMSLEALGKAYVDENAKEAGLVIKTAIKQIKATRKAYYKSLGEPFEDVEVNYQDVYELKPNLMLNYAADDIVVMLLYAEQAFKVLVTVDPELKTFERERKLISVIAAMEREGLKLDLTYADRSKQLMGLYRDQLQAKLEGLVGQSFTVGQHEWIKKMFQNKFGIVLIQVDEKALKKVYKSATNEDSKLVAKYIIELRTIEKWISTYIDGKITSSVNGRIYTSINNSGTVSGRVSCDMQQQPKEAMSDLEDKKIYVTYKDGCYDFATEKMEGSEELFHPRRMFIADEGTSLFFIDYSQMEMRVQAYYTILVMGGDINLCRAYIPFKCHSMLTDEPFDFKNTDHVKRWDSGEWLKDEDDQPWVEVDLHDVTTLGAFPQLNNDKKHPDFKHFRRWGKMANFLKVYQGGVNALMEQLDIIREIAVALNDSFNASFKGIQDYQKDVAKGFRLYKFVENLLGRRYYMSDLQNAYKGANYKIQGTCADLLKQKEIEIQDHVRSNKYNLRVVLPVHDELVIKVPFGEEAKVLELHQIMQNIPEIPYIPMLCEIEVTTTNWADKKLWNGEI